MLSALWINEDDETADNEANSYQAGDRQNESRKRLRSLLSRIDGHWPLPPKSVGKCNGAPRRQARRPRTIRGLAGWPAVVDGLQGVIGGRVGPAAVDPCIHLSPEGACANGAGHQV